MCVCVCVCIRTCVCVPPRGAALGVIKQPCSAPFQGAWTQGYELRFSAHCTQTEGSSPACQPYPSQQRGEGPRNAQATPPCACNAQATPPCASNAQATPPCASNAHRSRRVRSHHVTHTRVPLCPATRHLSQQSRRPCNARKAPHREPCTLLVMRGCVATHYTNTHKHTHARVPTRMARTTHPATAWWCVLQLSAPHPGWDSAGCGPCATR